MEIQVSNLDTAREIAVTLTCWNTVSCARYPLSLTSSGTAQLTKLFIPASRSQMVPFQSHNAPLNRRSPFPA